MNYHSDDWINSHVMSHALEALDYFDNPHTVGIFLQGSQNYGLDYENSDIDTKLIVLPTFKDIAFNRKPMSTTHIRSNNEHIDFKDARLYMQTFRKQNLNFVEILFTKYKYVNSLYEQYWNVLVENREKIAHMNQYQAIKTMKGMALEKYHAMEHEYTSKMDVLGQFQYDPKQLHHLLRIEQFLRRYIDGENYESCMIPDCSDYLLEVKRGCYKLEDARKLADATMAEVNSIADKATASLKNEADPYMEELLDEIQYELMEKCVRIEMTHS